ncbi:Alpha/Beta hydrolase protein [Chaetomium sp. MPI-CAGE-AT-0009]|nr:Alpha/Beta hydrolase protein [Chaetomium sp. MPI-CAGE-AT-0009]
MKMKSKTLSSSVLGALLLGAHAQFPPRREGITPGICETTPGVKSYSGYVHLPPNFLEDGDQDYPINTFFWFFEARKDPANAPLAIWLNGGPGGSSMMGVLEENGPCFVGPDSKSTYLNPWSWNNEVNMLYIDQPVQTGFSYDVLTNVTIQLNVEDPSQPLITPTNFTDGEIPLTNNTFWVGTTGSQKVSQTTNTTERSAHAMWHFLQTWLFEFPHYRPDDGRISLWAESYGGQYGPAFFHFFQEQNERIANGSLSHPGAHPLRLDTLGIINGAIDWSILAEAAFDFPYNNVYLHTPLYPPTLHASLLHNWTRPHGWHSQLQTCQHALLSSPSGTPPNTTTATHCTNTLLAFEDACFGTYARTAGRGAYDIAHPARDPFPAPHARGFLMRGEVQAALGVPVNYTGVSGAVGEAFAGSWDVLRRRGLLEVLGGVAEGVQWAGRERFVGGAGFARLVVDGEGDGEEDWKGLTKQVGRFSFTRLFQAGHEVPAYQPRAAYEVFRRAMGGWDVPTGKVRVGDEFGTEGRRDAWVMSEAPEMPVPRCYVLKPETCEPEVWRAVVNGTAVVKDWFVVEGGMSDEPKGGLEGDEL